MQNSLPAHLAQLWYTQPGGINGIAPHYFVVNTIYAPKHIQFTLRGYCSIVKVSTYGQLAKVKACPLHSFEIQFP